jgi:site-specific DNA-methyltransferase (adenine-specific)
MRTEFFLFQEDCITGMRRIPDGAVNIIVTSPPYNLGIDYGQYDDHKTKAQYLEWTLAWAIEAHRALNENGSFFLNIGASPSNPFLPHEVVLELGKLFVLQNTIHWIKAITVTTTDGEEISTGHFKPINSKRYLNNCHEYIFHFTKTGEKKIDRLSVGVAYADKSNIARWGHTNGQDKRCRGNNWFIPYKTIKNRDSDRPHPATFPVELPVKCIRLHGLTDDLVMLDPFLGIGHAALAAKECGVKTFYGFEIEPAFMDVAMEKLGIETGRELRALISGSVCGKM